MRFGSHLGIDEEVILSVSLTFVLPMVGWATFCRGLCVFSAAGCSLGVAVLELVVLWICFDCPVYTLGLFPRILRRKIKPLNTCCHTRYQYLMQGVTHGR